MDRRKIVIKYLQIVNMISDGKIHIQRFTMKMWKTQKNTIFLLLFQHTFNQLTYTVISIKAFGIMNKKHKNKSKYIRKIDLHACMQHLKNSVFSTSNP